ncbi:hypothetical protein [Streptomyces avidinii]
MVDSGTGERAGLNDRDSAGKTGTTDSRYNAWFVGYTSNMSGAVWVGSGGAKKITMENIVIGGKPYDKVFGGGLPGPIWKDAVSGALSGRESSNFTTVSIPEPTVPSGGPRGNKPSTNPSKPGKPGGDGKPGGRPGGQTAGANGGATGGGADPQPPFPPISIDPNIGGVVGGRDDQ